MEPESIENYRKGMKNYWASMTPEQRKKEWAKRTANKRKNIQLGIKSKPNGVSHSWKHMNAAERSAEVKRRHQVSLQKKGIRMGKSPFPKRLPSTQATNNMAIAQQERRRLEKERRLGKNTTRITIRERLAAIESAVAALREDLGL